LKNTDAARPGAAPAFSSEALAAVLRRLDLTPATPLKIAYSGGLDSHVLLHALSRLRDDGWRLSALHVDHGLQPAAGAWARHCEQVCRELALPITIERIEVRGIREHGLEAAARRARYACLARHVGPGEVLLTAHHQDDQAETLLLQLLRGSGVHGLAAMPAIAAFTAGRHARPLLEFPRRALLAYATAAGLKWIEDDSNRDDRLARNFIRNRLTPVIEERWPGAARRLGRSARHAAEAAALLDEIARAAGKTKGMITPESIRENVDHPELPDIDLVIRTSGETRTSNFFLWQSAYAEWDFLDLYFPDFGVKELAASVGKFAERTRRFGA